MSHGFPPPHEPGREEEPPVVGATPVEADEVPADEEVLDGVPVLANVRELAEPSLGALPAVQAAAVAAGGFFAGALTMALLKRYAARRLGESTALAPVPPPPSWPAGAGGTYLVHVRLVGRHGPA